MMSTEIPINQVARVYRMHVEGEADAMKADAIIKGSMPKIASVPGYVSFQRTVCKTEWAYEITAVFDSLDSFKAYEASDLREKELLPKLAELCLVLRHLPPSPRGLRHDLRRART